MAEAEVEANTSSRFYCHKCSAEITPSLPDYICPRCNCGFIERLESTPDSDTESDDDVDFNYLEVLDDALSQNAVRQNSQNSQSNTSSENRERRRRPTITRSRSRRQRSSGSNPALAPLLQDLMMHITSGVFEATVAPEFGVFPGAIEIPGFSMMVTSNLASNPADYVWGRGGLDAIITQLMNQLDGTGPPPLPKEKIAEIPTVHITKEQCDKNLQCSVCMEDFSLGEPVRKLYCDHCYHEQCIVPWLEMHGTCPICRKTMADQPNSASPSTANAQSTSGSSSSPRHEVRETFADHLSSSRNRQGRNHSSRNSEPSSSSMHEHDLD